MQRLPFGDLSTPHGRLKPDAAGAGADATRAFYPSWAAETTTRRRDAQSCCHLSTPHGRLKPLARPSCWGPEWSFYPSWAAETIRRARPCNCLASFLPLMGG